VLWGQDNVRGTENVALDKSASGRRLTFMHQWKVIGLSEKVCSNGTVTTCEIVPVDLFSSTYMEPSYECPQNTYKKDKICVPCAPEQTSRTGVCLCLPASLHPQLSVHTRLLASKSREILHAICTDRC
jgi:hypothetical protein